MAGLIGSKNPRFFIGCRSPAYHIFGVSEFAARFGSALFGLGTIASIWMLGRAVERRLPDRICELQFCELASTDRGIHHWDNCFFTRRQLRYYTDVSGYGVARRLFYLGIRPRTRQTSVSGKDDNPTISPSPRLLFSFSLAAFYFFIGVALIAKGLVGIVFPLAIVAFYYLLSRKFPPRAFIISLIWGTALALLVASAWYLPMYQRNGWTFIDEFFIQHHFQRYTSNKYLHPQPFYFFFWVLPLMTIPWLPFFLASLWNFIPRKHEEIRPAGTER